ncbi:SWIM zinc finger family protein [Streptomyces sp. NPDC014991]|uniref:SWIM zinc finger family protein n=1 Tax=Streptomyces sp. NPDC014991 TaxID=3364935 RepID=UPI0036F94AC3
MARAALRAAVATRRESGVAPSAAGSASRAGSAGAAGRRPGDVAREALRAARREALRAEAGEHRGGRRVPPRSGPSGPASPSAPGESSAGAGTRAVQDMRHYLANAFRMPTWAETPEEGTEPGESGESGGPVGSRGPGLATTAPTEPPASASPATPPAAPPASTPVAPVRPAPASRPASASAVRAPAPPTSTSTSPPVPSTPASPAPASSASPPAPPTASPPPGARPAIPSAPASTPLSPAPALWTSEPAPAAPVAREPAAAQVPATMATPHRDTELRRTFAAFGPREAGGDGESFAGTWWGNAWVEALEQGALDPERLARGRGYADQGHVDAITVTPGLVLAYVRGSRPRPYRVQVRLRTLEDEDWERFLDVAADRPGHIAALLDKELPHSLADCGVGLLPGPGDLAPRCSCPDSGHPCKHAAALCYQTARLLDADPFVLLLLRGRGEKELLDALSRRSAARAARAAQDRQPESLPGIRAADALAPRRLPPLPPALPVPPHPEQPPVYPSAPGGPDPFALDQLATDAAARAHALLGTGRDPVGGLTLWQDAVRLAAARPGSGLTAGTRTLYATLAGAAGRTPADLARAVAAWRQGGAEGLAVLEEPWDPPAGRFDRARPLLLAADLPAFRPWRNRLTHPRGHVQIRLGRDGSWYAYESEPGQDDWWPRGTPDLDPVGALTGLGVPEGL